MILQIALDTPLRRVFDYRPPAHFPGGGAQGAPQPGVRVRVPFGRRQLIGILVGVACESAIAAPKLKAALAILDERPILDPVTFDLLRWAADPFTAVYPVAGLVTAGLYWWLGTWRHNRAVTR